MSGRVPEGGEIRLRLLLEILFLLIITYIAFHVGPKVMVRINFLNEMEVEANSPIDKTEYQIKADLLKKAENYGLTILSDNLYVRRSPAEGKTVITAKYQIYISFWPRFVYVWNVEDEVEGYLL